MKEFSIEEKAKAYDEVLGKLREFYRDYDTVSLLIDVKEELANILPEIKESEDECIRKEIIYHIQNCDDTIDEETEKRMIAWLEKQGMSYTKRDVDDAYIEGMAFAKNELEKQNKQILANSAKTCKDEQKPADNVEPKFKVGDWIVYDKYDVKDIDKIVKLDNDKVSFESGEWLDIYQLNEDCKLWTIEDAKNGDVLSYKDEISLYKHDIKNCTKQETTFGGFVYHCCYDGKRFIIDSLYSLTEQDKMDIYPATKEQRDLLFQKMHEAGYEWDGEKKELKEIKNELGLQKVIKAIEEGSPYILAFRDGCYMDAGDDKESQIVIRTLKKKLNAKEAMYDKPTWSEEDERMFGSVVWHLRNSVNNGEKRHSAGQLEDWLESLKDRHTWKPSEEQMKALYSAINDAISLYSDKLSPLYEEISRKHFDILESLYNDLKKL